MLSIALVFAAPIYEELLFRGFTFRGLLASRAGAIGAVMITALLWSVIHLQYDVGRIFQLFVFGVLIGLARLRSGSIYPAILMHGTINLVAFVQIAWIAGRGG